MTPMPLSPFITEPDNRFVLDEDQFMADLAEMPAFLVNPTPEYLQAIDLMPIVKIIAGHAA